MKPLLLALAVGMAGCAHVPGPCAETTYSIKQNGGEWKSVDFCLGGDGMVRWREGR